MRKSIYILFFLSMLLSVSGCDMFRKLAKRPTSDELQLIKERIEREKLAAEEAYTADELSDTVLSEILAEDKDSLLKAINDAGIGCFDQSRLGMLDQGQSLPDYCIVFGLFGNLDNVARLCEKISAAGYKPLKINMTNSLVVVAAEPSDNLSTVFESYKKLSAEPFFTKDAWILSYTK